MREGDLSFLHHHESSGKIKKSYKRGRKNGGKKELAPDKCKLFPIEKRRLFFTI